MGQSQSRHCRVLFVTALCISTICQSQGTSLQSNQIDPFVPLVLNEITVNGSAKTVTFTISNPTSKMVTAWSVQALRDLGGVFRPVSGFGVEAYLNVAGLTPGGRHLPPGGARTETFPVDLGDSLATPVVELRPVMVIYEDGTAFGEPALIERWFKNRESDSIVWEECIDTLQIALKRHGRTAEALRTAVADLDSPVASDQTPARSAAIDSLRTALATVEKGGARADVQIGELLEKAQRRLAAANKHRVRAQ